MSTIETIMGIAGVLFLAWVWYKTLTDKKPIEYDPYARSDWGDARTWSLALVWLLVLAVVYFTLRWYFYGHL